MVAGPTFTLVALSSPSPGVQVTATAVDGAAVNVTIYRESASLGKLVVRGADSSLISGSFTVDDFEVPIGETVTYTGVTFDGAATRSDESADYTITVSSSGTWMSDPITPSSALQVTVQAWPEVSRSIDAELFSPIGATAPIMISGVRSQGSSTVALLTRTLDELNALRVVLDASPVVLLRTSTAAWDIRPQFVGVQGVSERRIGTLAEPVRVLSLDVTVVQRPVPSIAGPLHTWDEVLGTGLTWGAISAADLTWLQLAQRGGL